MSYSVVRAEKSDLDDVLALLEEVDLPVEGVGDLLGGFFVARDGEKLAGCVGFERYGETALLRSLAVSPSLQRGGYGRALTSAVIDSARSGGVKDIILLTTTAAEFFRDKFGFVPVERSLYDEVFVDSPEWHLPRCSSAACMHLKLHD